MSSQSVILPNQNIGFCVHPGSEFNAQTVTKDFHIRSSYWGEPPQQTYWPLLLKTCRDTIALCHATTLTCIKKLCKKRKAKVKVALPLNSSAIIIHRVFYGGRYNKVFTVFQGPYIVAFDGRP